MTEPKKYTVPLNLVREEFMSKGNSYICLGHYKNKQYSKCDYNAKAFIYNNSNDFVQQPKFENGLNTNDNTERTQNENTIIYVVLRMFRYCTSRLVLVTLVLYSIVYVIWRP